MLPTKKTPRNTVLQGKSIFLYGRQKIGKTEFGVQFPEPLFIATEEGTHAHEVFVAPVNTWTEAITVLDELKKNVKNLPYKTLVVDTVVNLHNMCTKHSVKQLSQKAKDVELRNADHPSDFGFGKGYADVNSRFFDFCNDLTRLGLTVIFIAHEKELTDEKGKPTGVVRSNLSPTAHRIIAGMCDITANVTMISGKTADGKNTAKRVLICHPSPQCDAGDRLKVLPPVCDLDFQKFQSYFAK